MSAKQPTSNSVSLAGEFAVLSQLALRGYDANLTLGNTKGVDILVSRPNSGMYRLEVKSAWHRGTGDGETGSPFWGRCFQWIMRADNEKTEDSRLFYCFVNIGGEFGASLRFFIVPSRLVATYVRDSHRLWLAGDPARKDTAIRNFRIATARSGYPLPTPSARRYENNWDFKR